MYLQSPPLAYKYFCTCPCPSYKQNRDLLLAASLHKTLATKDREPLKWDKAPWKGHIHCSHHHETTWSHDLGFYFRHFLFYFVVSPHFVPLPVCLVFPAMIANEFYLFLLLFPLFSARLCLFFSSVFAGFSILPLLHRFVSSFCLLSVFFRLASGCVFYFLSSSGFQLMI